MYSIKEKLEPLGREYDRWLNGEYLSGLLQFKGQSGVGNEYVSKVFRAQSKQANSKYQHAFDSVRNPTFSGFLQDNFLRMFALNVVERLVVAFQAAPTLNRLSRPNSLSFLFTEIMNDGAFKGSLRGLSFNFLQSSLVLWPSIYLTRHSEGDLLSFLSIYSVLDAILYPLDVIKNRLYGETARPQGIREVLAKYPAKSIYNGFLARAVFNLPFAAALFSTTQSDDNSIYYWLLTGLLYPLNTVKVRQQLNGTNIGSGLYRGVVPFLALNIFFSWQLTALFGKDKIEQIRVECAENSVKTLGYY